jgi:hypothetical protein
MMAQMTRAHTRTGFDVMRERALPDLGLPADHLPGAKAALRLAEFILSLSSCGSMASVAIDGASIRVGEAIVFDIGRFMAGTA